MNEPQQVTLPKNVVSTLIFLAEQGLVQQQYFGDPNSRALKRQKNAIRRAREAAKAEE